MSALLILNGSCSIEGRCMVLDPFEARCMVVNLIEGSCMVLKAVTVAWSHSHHTCNADGSAALS